MTAASAAPVQLVLLAKRPRPGRVKTRLSPTYTPRQAADLAAAALQDTIDAVAAARCVGRVLAFDGPPGGWLPAGFGFVRQRGDGLAERLRYAIADAYARHPLAVLLVGMDTPQVTPAMLESAARSLVSSPYDAVLGPATDGGFWTIGMRRPHHAAFSGVPMSTATTCREQLRQLAHLRLRVGILRPLTDVDDAATAEAVAAIAPRSRFAACLGALRLDPADGTRRSVVIAHAEPSGDHEGHSLL
ncbi:MAG: TIGR04282 family arsenosugar biosynthesis glycosyltransferase [Streptosporangiales bacterium]